MLVASVLGDAYDVIITPPGRRTTHLLAAGGRRASHQRMRWAPIPRDEARSAKNCP
jgi:hypothetical protein